MLLWTIHKGMYFMFSAMILQTVFPCFPPPQRAHTREGQRVGHSILLIYDPGRRGCQTNGITVRMEMTLNLRRRLQTKVGNRTTYLGALSLPKTAQAPV